VLGEGVRSVGGSTSTLDKSRRCCPTLPARCVIVERHTRLASAATALRPLLFARSLHRDGRRADLPTTSTLISRGFVRGALKVRRAMMVDSSTGLRTISSGADAVGCTRIVGNPIV